MRERQKWRLSQYVYPMSTQMLYLTAAKQNLPKVAIQLRMVETFVFAMLTYRFYTLSLNQYLYP